MPKAMQPRSEFRYSRLQFYATAVLTTSVLIENAVWRSE